MSDAQRKALQVFWNTLGIAVVILACCLAYMGMLWLGTQIAEATASTSGGRLVVFLTVMCIQLGLLAGIARAWIAYRKALKP